MDNKMFCYQCQETAACKGCTVKGVCGKTPEVAAMQDLLVYVTKGLLLQQFQKSHKIQYQKLLEIPWWSTG